jgi:hypothetical protein
MVRDVLKMMHFRDHVAQRHNELERLASGRGLRRDLKLGSFAETISVPHFLENGNTAPYQWSATETTHWDIWAHVRWKPGADQAILSEPRGSDEKSKFVRALLQGTSKRNDVYSYARDAWEIIPWSWMIDWFTNVGDFLDANRNQNIAQVDKILVMLHAITTRTEQCSAVGKVVSTLETKIRSPGEISLEAVGPYVTADKAAILSGLAVGDKKHRLPLKYR